MARLSAGCGLQFPGSAGRRPGARGACWTEAAGLLILAVSGCEVRWAGGAVGWVPARGQAGELARGSCEYWYAGGTDGWRLSAQRQVVAGPAACVWGSKGQTRALVVGVVRQGSAQAAWEPKQGKRPDAGCQGGGGGGGWASVCILPMLVVCGVSRYLR